MKRESWLSNQGKKSDNQFVILRQTSFDIKDQLFPREGEQKKLSFDEVKKMIDEEQVKLNNSNVKESLPFQSYFFRTVGRDQFQRTLEKYQTPIVGHYLVNYQLVQRKDPSAVFVEKKHLPRCVSLPRPKLNKRRKNEVQSPPKIRGVEFNKQLKRPKFITLSQNFPHERRFTHFNSMPNICSNYKRQRSVNFEGYSPRKPQKFVSQSTDNFYNPNKEYVMSKISSNINLRQMTSRTELFPSKEQINTYYDINYNAIHKKMPSYDFTRPTEKQNIQNSYSMTSLKALERHKRNRDRIQYASILNNL